jgi:hypothetical protein
LVIFSACDTITIKAELTGQQPVQKVKQLYWGDKKMKKIMLMICMVLMLLATSAIPADNTVYVTKKDYPMALTKEDLDMFHQSILNDDAAVFLKLRQEGRAWLSRAGVQVYIVENEDSGKVKIKPKNTTQEIWTLQEALEKK